SLPGFKVFHLQDLDFRSHFLLFREYLEELKNWSLLNPNHLPVFITINAKDGKYPELGLTEPLDFDAPAFKALDDTINKVFGPEKLLMPKNIKNGHENLEAAVTQGGWPELDATRGKFVFILDEKGVKMEQYLLNDPQLDQSVMFVDKKEGDPLAAIRIINDPIENHEYIQTLVKKGYLVRTRADADTREARKNDTKRRKMAFFSGAQLISTDYYLPDSTISTAYQVVFETGSYQRINPFFEGKWAGKGQLEEGLQAVVPLDPSEFFMADKKMVNFLLDVRTQQEVDEGIIPQATHIDFLKDDFEDKVVLLDKEKPILVYCKVGGRSAKASEKMLKLGFKKVYHLEGGMDDWKESGFPIENK
ncbi:MAG: Ca2+-dependent phosphoinositide-specific phospholipase C, partial [Cyclobacteriaceae bacterium]